MREFSISFFVDIVNNLLAFLILDKYSDYYLKHRYSESYHSKRFYYFIPLQLLLSALSSHIGLYMILLLLSYFFYTVVIYRILFKKVFAYICKFFILYYGLTAVIFFLTSFIIDFIPGSKTLITNSFYQNIKGILLSSLLYIFSCFFLNHKKLMKQAINNPYKRYIYLVLGLIVLVLCSFIIYIYTLDSSKEALENVVMVIFLINILLIVLILSIYEKIVDSLQEAALKQLQQQKYELAQNYYDELAEKSKQLLSLRHDFKNHLGVIAGRLERKDYSEALAYLEKITDATKYAGDLVITNSAAVSAILQSKKMICERKGITFNYTAAFEKIYTLTDMDFTIILGNILDNAIEAMEAVLIADKYLSVSLTQANTYLAIQCENPYIKEPITKNGFLISSKNEKDFHGIGLINVTEVCEKCGGEFYYTYDGSIFVVKILLPNY